MFWLLLGIFCKHFHNIIVHIQRQRLEWSVHKSAEGLSWQCLQFCQVSTFSTHWGHLNREIPSEQSLCRRELQFQLFFFISWLWGIYRTNVFGFSFANGFFKKITILEPELQIKKTKNPPYHPLLYSHCIFSFTKIWL